jgi:hypothetical protein
LRKLLSIFLLLILLFNIVGYRAWFYYAEKFSDATLESRLDKNQFQENDLVTLSIPLNNPYQVDQSGFERSGGEINIQGESFTIVERKLSGGKLQLHCIPNVHKSILKKAKTEYGNDANDLSNNAKGSRSGSQKNFSGSDYIFEFTDKQTFNYAKAINTEHSLIVIGLTDPYHSLPGKPPRVIA